MSDYTIQLEQLFKGPMDLLLHLVREQEVEIHEVEIHRVIDGYFEYLERLEDLDIETAGDFLVMAATLMAIKSRALLPRDEVSIDDDFDPEDELIQRLIEYRRFKSAAENLETRLEERAREFERGYDKEVADHEPERTLELGELTAWDLLSTFSRLMRETLANRPMHVRGDARPLRWYVAELGRAILAERSLDLRSLLGRLEAKPTREGLIGAFCALLELMRLGVVTARQERLGDDIEVVLREDERSDFEALIQVTRFMDEERAAAGDDEVASEPGSAAEAPLE